MKKNKFVKLIEHVLVALPLLYVGGVGLYTMLNENSKDSYYSDTENEVIFTDDLVYSNEYYYDNTNLNYFGGNTLILYVSNLTLIDSGNLSSSNINNFSNANCIQIRFDSGVNRFYLYNGDTYLTNMNNQSYFVCSFDFVSYGNTNRDSNMFFYVDYADYSFLNNALPNAMSEFNKLGFNKIPFTQFFVNIFHNGNTNVYIDFVNNYLNYMLFVECTYFIPMVLYWFIHFGEDVVDRFTRKGDRL